MDNVYISVDIETGGSTAGIHPMLSLGAAAYDDELNFVSSFYANISSEDSPFVFSPSTMEWWGSYPEQWGQATSSTQKPLIVMQNFIDFVEDARTHTANYVKLQKRAKPIFVAKPVQFDIPFIKFYLAYYLDVDDLIRATIDLRSFIMGVYNVPYIDSHPSKINELKPYQNANRNAHNALDDAIMQGDQFVEVYRRFLVKGFINEQLHKTNPDIFDMLNISRVD